MSTGRTPRLAYVGFIACLLCAFVAVGRAKPRALALDAKSQVMEIVFRDTELITDPWFEKWTLRYGDSESQLVLVFYTWLDRDMKPKKQLTAEVIRFTLAGMTPGKLDEMIDRAWKEEQAGAQEHREAEGTRPNAVAAASEEEGQQAVSRIAQSVAARLKVDIARVSVDAEPLRRQLGVSRLKRIKLSPRPAARVCVDQCPDYEYLYEAGSGWVHYGLIGRPGKSDREPEDDIARWMMAVRSSVASLFDR